MTGVDRQSLSALDQLQRLLLPSVTGQTQTFPEVQDSACAETSEPADSVHPEEVGLVVVALLAVAVPTSDVIAVARMNSTASIRRTPPVPLTDLVVAGAVVVPTAGADAVVDLFIGSPLVPVE
ncbi:hypothetical protein [Saccharothrix sp. HUAS TT1]|uniref:hypothetical protein n=1 Tax=unclassified Saccharothrix TaxID=2593673 RepID=UPI00345C27D9